MSILKCEKCGAEIERHDDELGDMVLRPSDLDECDRYNVVCKSCGWSWAEEQFNELIDQNAVLREKLRDLFASVCPTVDD